MSIYGTVLHLTPDEGDEDGPAPIVYQGSHVLPSPHDPRNGLVGLAQISGWITRDGRDDGPDDDSVWPYLRLDVATRIVAEGDREQGELLGTAPDMATVVLDAGQVRIVRDVLSGWLDQVGGV